MSVRTYFNCPLHSDNSTSDVRFLSKSDQPANIIKNNIYSNYLLKQKCTIQTEHREIHQKNKKHLHMSSHYVESDAFLVALIQHVKVVLVKACPVNSPCKETHSITSRYTGQGKIKVKNVHLILRPTILH